MPEVFEQLRVVDFSQGMAGPLAGMVMADYGADVIKVEPPGGDWARSYPGFLLWNRGKRSVVLDLHHAADRAKAVDLVGSADVAIAASSRPLEQALGLGEGGLEAINPGLVHCSITGFGLAASHEDLLPYEWIVSAKAGRLEGNDRLSGVARDENLGRPVFVAAPINDYGAAILAVQGITAALIAREATGRGQGVQTSLLDGASAATMRMRYERQGDKVVAVTRGATRSLVHQGIMLTFLTVRCKDGRYIQMCARQDSHFRNWLRAVGLEHLMDQERFRGAPLGLKSEEDIRELEELLREKMAQKTQAEWMRIFIEDYDVGADPFLTPDEFLAHPQMVENGRVIEIEDPTVGTVRELGPIVNFSATPARIEESAPALNAHKSVLDWQEKAKARPRPEPVEARPQAPAPLAGVTILEVAYFLAGPWGATLLAELGARVIKVEPLEGDPFRRVGLELVHQVHGKESIALDLKTLEGQQVLHRLAAGSDALLHSFRPGVPERLGMDYATLQAVNPRLVYVYGGSYGSKGPESHRAAFHSTPNALNGGGILQAGQGNPPVDDSYPDPCSGLAVGAAIAMGVLAQRRHGVGQYVETTMLCSSGYVHSNEMVRYAGRPEMPVSGPDQLGPHALCRLYHCAEGWLFLAAFQDKEWQALCRALGHPEWLDDSRFRDRTARWSNDKDLSTTLEGIFATDRADRWEARLRNTVPVANASEGNMEEFMVREGLVSSGEHPAFGTYWRLPPRVRFTSAPNREGAPCGLGEHTEAILEEFGYSEEERAKLRQAGVVK